MFEDQAALDRYVRNVLIAHLDSAETSALDSMTVVGERRDLAPGAREALAIAVKAVVAVQRISIQHLPLPVVPR